MTVCRNIQFVASAGTGKTHQVVSLYQCLLFGRPYPPTDTALPGMAAGSIFSGTARIEPEKIIMLTFTRNAAAEMRARVTAAIEQELAAGDTGTEAYCWSLLRRLSSASIATIHSFAQQLLAAHTLHLGLSPELHVLEEAEASNLRAGEIQEALKAMLASSPQEALSDIESLCLGRGIQAIEVGVARTLQTCGSWGLDLADADPATLVQPPTPPGVPELEELKKKLDNAAWQKSKKLQEVATALLQTIRNVRAGNPSAAELADRIAAAAEDIRKLSKGTWGRNEDIKALKAETEAALTRLASYPDQCLATRLLISFLALARDAAARIRNRKRTLGVLDFDDLLFQARTLIRSRPSAIPETQVIIVDEAQDNSRLQNELIRMIHAETKASLILCGDTKQTIYGWRGADPLGLPSFADSMKLTAVPLRTSYRSQKGILDWVNDIFAGVVFNVQQYGTDETLLPCPAAAPLTGPSVELLLPPWESTPGPQDSISIDGAPSRRRVTLCRNDFRKLAATDDGNPQWQSALEQQEQAVAMEARTLARRIRLLTSPAAGIDWHPALTWDSARGTWRKPDSAPYRFRDILILLRAGSRQEIYEQALQEEGIPFTTDGKGRGFFARQETLDLCNLLSWLAFPNDRLAWLALLRSPFVALSDNAIAVLELRPETNTRQVDRDLAALRQNGLDSDADALLRATPPLARLRSLAGRVNAVDLVREAVRLTGYDAILAGTFHGIQRLANLQKLLTWIQDRERDETLNLQETARRLVNEINGRRETPDAAVLDPDDDSVRINTIHAAKGLSSPVVILPDLRRLPRWDQDWALMVREAGGTVSGVAAKLKHFTDEDASAEITTAQFEQASEQGRADRDQESRRLFYVACTRARDLLILSGENPFNGNDDSWRSWINRHLLQCDFAPHLVTLRPYADVEHAWRAIARPAPEPPVPAPGDFTAVNARRLADTLTERYRFPVTALTFPDPGVALSLAPAGVSAANAEDRESPDPAPDRALAGTIAHRILEDLDYQSEVPLETRIAASPVWNDVEPNTPGLARLRKQAAAAAAVLSKLLAGVPPGSIIRELPFAARFAHDNAEVIVDGKADLLFFRDGCWHLVDYKFSDHSPAELKARYALQLRVYLEALSAVPAGTDLRAPRFACANPAPAKWKVILLAIGTNGRCHAIEADAATPEPLPAMLVASARRLAGT